MKDILFTIALLICSISFGQTLKELNDNGPYYDGLLQQYANSGDYKSAIELGEKFLQTDFLKSNNLARAIMYTNLGTYNGHLSFNHNGSSDFLKKSNEYYNKVITMEEIPAWLLADCYNSLGSNFGKSQKALYYIDLAIYVIEKHPDRSSIDNRTKGMIYNNKAYFLYHMGYKRKEVCKFATKANKFARDYPRASDIYINLRCN